MRITTHKSAKALKLVRILLKRSLFTKLLTSKSAFQNSVYGSTGETCETGVKVLKELHRQRGSEAHRHRVWDRYQIILHLSNECWNFFRKWRRRNLVLVEKDTGARVDSTNNAWQTLHISGQKEAVKKLAMVIQTLPGGGIEQSR